MARAYTKEQLREYELLLAERRRSTRDALTEVVKAVAFLFGTGFILSVSDQLKPHAQLNWSWLRSNIETYAHNLGHAAQDGGNAVPIGLLAVAAAVLLGFPATRSRDSDEMSDRIERREWSAAIVGTMRVTAVAALAESVALSIYALGHAEAVPIALTAGCALLPTIVIACSIASSKDEHLDGLERASQMRFYKRALKRLDGLASKPRTQFWDRPRSEWLISFVVVCLFELLNRRWSGPPVLVVVEIVLGAALTAVALAVGYSLNILLARWIGGAATPVWGASPQSNDLKMICVALLGSAVTTILWVAIAGGIAIGIADGNWCSGATLGVAFGLPFVTGATRCLPRAKLSVSRPWVSNVRPGPSSAAQSVARLRRTLAKLKRGT